MTQKTRTVNMNNIRVKGTLTFATNHLDFPMYPEVGETALVRGALYIYTKLDGIKTWYQLTEKRDTYFHIQNYNERKWIINHNFRTDANSFFVYVEDNLTTNYDVTYKDDNRIELSFNELVKGSVTVFKYPEINTLDITADSAHIKKNFKWSTGFSTISKFPHPYLHNGMVTVAKDTGLLYYSDGRKWKKIITESNTDELKSNVVDQIRHLFNSIDYKTIQNTPDLKTLKVDWKYLQNKPELGTKNYKELNNTPKLIYSRMQKVETQSRLKYTFVDNMGKNLFINSSWIQVFTDGKLVCPTKYILLNEYEIQFTNGQELNSEIQIVTIG
jgi:hypothetical protein